MGNMLTYIKEYGDRSFTQMPFCEVDSLVLAQLAYFVFDGYVSARHKFDVTVRDIAQLSDESITLNTTLPRDNTLLLEAVKDSVRFGELPLACYKSVTDTKSELQFAAVTLRLTTRLHYIAFRGTDTTLVGWKEDFNLAYSENIPSQAMAATYLKRTARYLRGSLILGGHSKGGHLAVYAAMHAPYGIKKRIQAIYNHDGPGFLPAVFASEAYKSIQERIYKTVPHSSIVGMLLANYGPHTVVASKSLPLLQHNPFTWEIQGADFVRLKKVDLFSSLTNKTLTAWMESLLPETRKAFVDTLFEILQSTNATTYPELLKALRKDFSPIREKVKSLDAPTRTMMQKVLRSFAKTGAAQLRLLLKKEKK